MRRSVALWLALAGLGLGSFPGRAAAEDWVLRKNADGVEVYTRGIPGSGLDEFRGVTRVRSALRPLVEAILDADRYPEWMHDCAEARSLERDGVHEGRTYNVTDLPWPMSDRDVVVHWRLTQSANGSVTIALAADSDYLPPQERRIRVPRSEGVYRFTPVGDGQIEVVYQLHSEPGGRLPEWLSRSWVVAAPFHTLKNLHRFLEQQGYSGSDPAYGSIREPSP